LFAFLSQSVHRREKDFPEGDCRNQKVVMSNILVSNLAVLLVIMTVRSVLIVVEQPQNSKLWFHWAIARIIQPRSFRRVWTWMRCFGHDLPKPSMLVANFSTALQLRRVWSLRREVANSEIGDAAWDPSLCPSVLAKYSVSRADKLNNAAYHKNGPNGKVQGTKKLATAAAYTIPFAREIFRSWVNAVRLMGSQADCTPVLPAIYKVGFANAGLLDIHSGDIYHTMMPAAGPRFSLRCDGAVKRRLEPKEEPSSEDDDAYVAVATDPYTDEQ
jgi:hypothetical protein